MISVRFCTGVLIRYYSTSDLYWGLGSGFAKSKLQIEVWNPVTIPIYCRFRFDLEVSLVIIWFGPGFWFAWNVPVGFDLELLDAWVLNWFWLEFRFDYDLIWIWVRSVRGFCIGYLQLISCFDSCVVFRAYCADGKFAHKMRAGQYQCRDYRSAGIPFHPILVDFIGKSGECMGRWQFPFVNSPAISIHAGQGLSVEREREHCGDEVKGSWAPGQPKRYIGFTDAGSTFASTKTNCIL